MFNIRSIESNEQPPHPPRTPHPKPKAEGEGGRLGVAQNHVLLQQHRDPPERLSEGDDGGTHR